MSEHDHEHNHHPVAALSDKERQLVESISHKRERAFERFPLVFTLLASFGLVATFYGFERVIDRFQIFSDNPFILLITGISTLILTGTLYSKL